MGIIESMKKRRSYYVIGDAVADKKYDIINSIKEVTQLGPHAFNVKSTRIALVLGEKNKELWDEVYNSFDGKVAREKIDSFKAGYGTVLYFYEPKDVESLQEQFPPYAQNLPWWAAQALGMQQLSIWVVLRDLGIGASIQHYNPIIDERVKTLLGLPESWVLNAQMPFGNIIAEPDTKETEDITQRFKLFE